MSDIGGIVDALEFKIGKIISELDDLKLINSKLTKALASAKQEILSYKDLNAEWEERYRALKIANTMLGSDENKRETKLKINALIRDIDHCIAQLSD